MFLGMCMLIYLKKLGICDPWLVKVVYIVITTCCLSKLYNSKRTKDIVSRPDSTISHPSVYLSWSHERFKLGCVLGNNMVSDDDENF